MSGPPGNVFPPIPWRKPAPASWALAGRWARQLALLPHKACEGHRAMNLYDVFAETAGRQPAHPAVLGPGENELLTYSALQAAICLAAEGLQKAGLRPG